MQQIYNTLKPKKTKPKLNSDICSKSKHRAFRKGNRKIPQKRFYDRYCLDGHSGIDDWDFSLLEQCETHKQLKEREIFWQH